MTCGGVSLNGRLLARLAVERRFGLPAPGVLRFSNCVLDVEACTVEEAGSYSWQDRVPNAIDHEYHPDASPIRRCGLARCDGRPCFRYQSRRAALIF